jgi:hypothetical protein
MTHRWRGFLCLFSSFLLLPVPAFAYIDPGTGSTATAFVLGLFAAVAYTFRKYMYRLRDLLGGRRTGRTADRPGERGGR